MRNRISHTLLLLSLILVPVGTRVMLHLFTPGFHEYETAFLYLSDIPVLLLAVYGAALLFHRKRSHEKFSGTYVVLFGFLCLAGISAFFALDALSLIHI